MVLVVVLVVLVVVIIITVVIVSGSSFGSVDSGYDDHSGGSFW